MEQTASPTSLPAVEIVTAKIEKNRVKAILKARDLTQEEAARRVGISYRQMNRIALDHSDPSLLLAAKIAVVLGEPLESIFKIKITTRKRLVRS
jgi:DNA-binding XRE family transcriptional regulator